MRGYEEQLTNQDLLQSIKEQREHAERGVEELLKHFSEEGKYFDDLRYLGSKYENRIKEFQSLVAENSDLKEETKKLQMQLNLLRSSMQDSGWKEDDILNRMSMDKGKPETVNTFNESSREAMKSKMEEISKMKGQARSFYTKQSADYDEILKKIIHFFEMSLNTKALLEEMRPAEQGKEQSDDQMVSVPRRRYELLVDLYALNMADMGAKQFGQLLQKNQLKDEKMLLEEESKRRFQQKYQIMKQESLSTANLEHFFKRLSERLGFESQWNKYHTENENEAIRLKETIDQILGKPSSVDLLEIAKKEEKDDKQPLGIVTKQLRLKLNNLVSKLPFSSKQKQAWLKLSEKIQADSLLDMEKIVQMFRKEGEQAKKKAVEDFADFLKHNLGESIKGLDNFLGSKIKKKENQIFAQRDVQQLIKIEELQARLQKRADRCSLADLLQESKYLFVQVQGEILQKLKKQVLFMSQGEMFAALKRRR